MNPEETLLYWITNRYQIYLNKEAGLPKPWSPDAIFQETYFCNVHRENDRVTRWIRENWNNPDDPHYTQAMCMARFVNKPSTLERLGYPFTYSADTFERVMGVLDHPWGGAYIVSTNGRKMPKAEYISQLILSYWEVNLAVPKGSTLLAMFNRLKALNGIGSFMAGQVIADLKNTVGHPLHEAPDWWTWSTHGPGSLRGLSWWHGEKITPSTYDTAIAYVRANVNLNLPDSIPKFCNQDLQNCLCEYDKYMRIKNGTGRSKRRYNGKNV